MTGRNDQEGEPPMVHPSTDIPADQEPTPHIIRWEAPDHEHPVIAELRCRAAQVTAGHLAGTPWGVVQAGIVGGYAVLNEAALACRHHDQVVLEQGITTLHARWLSDDEHAAKVAAELAKPAADAQAGGG